MATVEKRGDRYRVRVRREGMGSVSRSFTLKKDAEAWGRATEAAIERGDYDATPKSLDTDPKQVTLAQLVERYRVVSQRKKGSKAEGARLDTLLKHPIAKKKLSELKTSDWAGYRDSRLEKIKPQSLKREFNVYKHMLQLAIDEWNFNIGNSLTKLKLDYTDVQRDRRLKDGELELILAEAGRRKNKLLVPIIQWAVATGMRRSEILALRWQHVNLKDRLLVIPESKNGHARTLPITKEMMAVLEGLAPVSEHCFPMKEANLSNTWKRILTKLGLIGSLRFHDLRREAVSTFFERGLAVQEVAVLSGHSDWRMLKRYTVPKPLEILRKLELVKA